MILFTGTGALSSAFAKLYSCNIVSARFLDDSKLESLITSSKTIIHNAASLSSPSLSNYVDSNFILTKRILDIAYNINPNIKFINISSMSILKTANTYLDTTEMSDYALSKYFAEIYCLNHSIKRLTNVRFSTIFYKDPQRDGLSKLIKDAVVKKRITIFNNGESCRDFIPIDIVAKYLFKICEKDTFPEKINIVSGMPFSFRYFVDKLLLNNPNIEVEDVACQTKNVLHNFDKDGINYLGKIDFDMDYELNNYINSIYASLDL
jgi:nucleoside-diphosphate-sugar epimerase